MSKTNLTLHPLVLSQQNFAKFLFSFFFFGLLTFLGPLLRHMEVPRLGVGAVATSHQPPATSHQPQPQPRQIRAASATYITAHGNTGSLTH